MSVNVAIVGATGAVGQEFLTVLAERKFPMKSLRLLLRRAAREKTVEFGGKNILVEELTKRFIQRRADRLLFRRWIDQQDFAPAAVAAGAVVIDNTSAFRMKDGIPLVVPEVNPEQIIGTWALSRIRIAARSS